MIGRSIFTCLLMLTLSAGSAFAAPLSITNVRGGWTNPAPSGNVDLIDNKANQGTDSIYWGSRFWHPTVHYEANDSAYQFTPVDSPNLVALARHSYWAILFTSTGRFGLFDSSHHLGRVLLRVFNQWHTE